MPIWGVRCVIAESIDPRTRRIPKHSLQDFLDEDQLSFFIDVLPSSWRVHDRFVVSIESWSRSGCVHIVVGWVLVLMDPPDAWVFDDATNTFVLVCAEIVALLVVASPAPELVQRKRVRPETVW